MVNGFEIIGQRVVKEWSKSGQRVVKEWSKSGQRVVKEWSKSGRRGKWLFFCWVEKKSFTK